MEPETLQRGFRDMLLLRRFEEKASQLYGMGMIGGFCHLYIGQEAVVTGVQYALGPGDSVITGYRCHAHMLIAGVPARDVMAELTGRAAGASKGKGGSMHMFSRDKNFFGGHGIVGAQVPIGTGIAFAQKYRGDGGVTAAYMGDGALNQGQVHEALNLAALWSLPIVFVIENNRYGMGTSVERASALPELHRVAEPFGMPSAQTDGMDVVAVRDAGRTAMEHCRAGEGPYVLEALTYRYRGHSMSDPAKYRSKEEVAEMRAEHDPIQNLRTQLTAIGAADEDSLKEIDRDIRTVVADAAEFAQNSPEPDPGELLTDVLIEA
jgi:pyruvate dehydrogenase E1 component alpha subunit